jgi:hypothetical protein
MCDLPLTLFCSGYGDVVPVLQYSAPVVKAIIDGVKVCHCGMSHWSPSALTCDIDHR